MEWRPPALTLPCVTIGAASSLQHVLPSPSACLLCSTTPEVREELGERGGRAGGRADAGARGTLSGRKKVSRVAVGMQITIASALQNSSREKPISSVERLKMSERGRREMENGGERRWIPFTPLPLGWPSSQRYTASEQGGSIEPPPCLVTPSNLSKPLFQAYRG